MAAKKPETTTAKLRLSKTTLDMMAGACAGIVATFANHPLDTVKLRYQLCENTNKSLTFRNMVLDIYRNEGVFGFYKGVLSPVFARWPVNAVLFGGKEFARRYVDRFKFLSCDAKNFISGMFAGFCYTNSAFVFDLLKVRAQQNK